MGADFASGEASDPVVDAGGSAPVTVHIRCSNGTKFSVQVALASTVGAFKAIVVEKAEVPAEQQRLIYKGRILKDEQTLESYGGLPSDFPLRESWAVEISLVTLWLLEQVILTCKLDRGGRESSRKLQETPISLGRNLSAVPSPSVVPRPVLPCSWAIATGARAGLGDGQKCLFWKDSWCGDFSLESIVISIITSLCSFRIFFFFSTPFIRIQVRIDEYGDGIGKTSSQGYGWRLPGGPTVASFCGVKFAAFCGSETDLGPASWIGNCGGSYFIPRYGRVVGYKISTSCRLESDHTIHLVRGFVSPASGNAPTGSTIGDSRSLDDTQGTGSGRGLGSNESGGMGTGRGASFGGSLFPGLGARRMGGQGASGLFGTSFQDFDQVHQQLTQNPDMMREIMNLPAVQNLVNNPDLMRNLIMGNPLMRDIIDRNPELAHILNDPSTLRQTLEAARNPELMREMMRNTDRAMSNIESSPEGFNMLRRMYETVQEPFLNATTLAAESGTGVGSNPFAALLRNQDASQNRDSSANPSTDGSETTGSAPNTNPLPNPWGNPAGGVQNNNTMSPPASGAPAPGLGGLGGLVFPELEQMAGGMQDQSLLNQFMQNPALSQMMQSLLSDPQYVNQILGFNPQMRSLLESNTQLREMLQNPEFLRQLTSPETMQQLLTLQQSLLSLNRQRQGQEQNQAGSGAAIKHFPSIFPLLLLIDYGPVDYGRESTPSNMGLEFLMNMFGGLAAGGLNAPNTSDVPPEQLYATQLSQLQEMGFFDTQENIRALSATAGNVHAAVERLLGNPGQ
ncbi:hypothetical protein Taro_037575 [Colocasia esculenta]|uniref:Uncharacterized protein n=1 Tax=Colocasia esculenta TaxID=4460 RepID=A0A843WGN4_COLES|nr:hypothetical protein [Colocasia esculenta]